MRKNYWNIIGLMSGTSLDGVDIVYTRISKNIAAFEGELIKEWEELPRSFITSTKKKIGKREILEYIKSINP